MSGYRERVAKVRKRGHLPFRESNIFRVVPENEYVPPTSPIVLGDTWEEHFERRVKRRKNMAPTQPTLLQQSIDQNKENQGISSSSPTPPTHPPPLQPKQRQQKQQQQQQQQQQEPSSSKHIPTLSTQREASPIQQQAQIHHQTQQEESGIQLQTVNTTQTTSIEDKSNQTKELSQERSEEKSNGDEVSIGDINDEADMTILFDTDMSLVIDDKDKEEEGEETRSIIYIDSDTDDDNEGPNREARMARDALYIKEEDKGVQSVEEKEKEAVVETVIVEKSSVALEKEKEAVVDTVIMEKSSVTLEKMQSFTPEIDIDDMNEQDQDETQPKESAPVVVATTDSDESEEEKEEEYAYVDSEEKEEEKEEESAHMDLEVKDEKSASIDLEDKDEEKEPASVDIEEGVEEQNVNRNQEGNGQIETEPQNEEEMAATERDTMASPGLNFDNDDNYSIDYDHPEEYNPNERLTAESEASASENEQQARPTAKPRKKAKHATSTTHQEIDYDTEEEVRESHRGKYRKMAETEAKNTLRKMEARLPYIQARKMRRSNLVLANIEAAMGVLFEAARRYSDVTYDKNKKKLIELFYENYRTYLHDQEVLLLSGIRRDILAKRIDDAILTTIEQKVEDSFKILRTKKDIEETKKKLEKSNQELMQLMEMEDLFTRIKNRTSAPE